MQTSCRQFNNPYHIILAANQRIAGTAIQIDMKILCLTWLMGMPYRDNRITGILQMAALLGAKNQIGIFFRCNLCQLIDVQYCFVSCKIRNMAGPFQRSHVR